MNYKVFNIEALHPVQGNGSYYFYHVYFAVDHYRFEITFPYDFKQKEPPRFSYRSIAEVYDKNGSYGFLWGPECSKVAEKYRHEIENELMGFVTIAQLMRSSHHGL